MLLFGRDLTSFENVKLCKNVESLYSFWLLVPVLNFFFLWNRYRKLT